MNRSALVVLALVATVSSAPPPAAADTPLTLETVGFFNWPVYVTHAPGDSERLFVVQRFGLIRIVKGPDVLTFLDLSAQVEVRGESGVLGMAFHPDYQSNGKFYVFYTVDVNGSRLRTIVEEFQVTADPDVADPNSARPIIGVERPSAFHLGGWLDFSPLDGLLYIAFGESQDSANSQDLSNLLGKILRIDIDGDDFPADPDRNYAIPPDNPFVNETGEDEIWAWGLRNAWRCSFDRETGDLWIGDVGHENWEEIDVQPANSPGGENYGWGCMEGVVCMGSHCTCNAPELTLPIHTYATGPCGAVIGGHVYRGCAIPDLRGTYFYGDWCQNKIWSFRYDGANVTEFQDRTAELGEVINSVPCIGADFDGELYVANSGVLQKIVPAGAVEAETVCPASAGDFSASFGGVVTGDASLLCDSDDARLTMVNKLPVTPLLPYARLETWARTHFCGGPYTSVQYTVEGGVTALVGGGQNPNTLRTFIRNYTSGLFELVDQRATNAGDEVIVHVQAANASDYVKVDDGEIRIRVDAFNPGNAINANWMLRLDAYSATVTP